MDQSHAGVPWPVPDEVARPKLISRLAQRWAVPVTVVVAGAGFGKSTALAQAFRTDQLAPSGHEGWVSIQPGLEHADFLCAEILSALGVKDAENKLPDLIRAIREFSPLDVCLIIDDVHKVPAGSSSARLLSGLVGSLPANAHLVLSGRSVDAVALSRLRAAGAVQEITDGDLCFDSAECAQLSISVGRAPAVGAPYGGWPALLRLSLSASNTTTAAGFVQEEVLAGLADEQRRALFALATVGSADAALAEQICGTPVDLGSLALQVPLVVRAGETDYRAHDLWSEVLFRTLAPSTVKQMRARAVAALTERGDLSRAGSLAIRHGDWPALAAVALELVKTTMMSLPVDTAVGWLAQVPAERQSAPELRLLAAAVQSSRDYTLPTIDLLIDSAAEEFRRQGNRDAELVAITLGVLAAGSRYDDERTDILCERVEWLQHQDERADTLGWRFARGNAAAALAEIRGEPELALGHLEHARLESMPPAVTRTSYRLLMRCLLLAGRAQEAAELAEATLCGGTNHHLAHVPAFARWIGGDPSGFTQQLVTDYERGMDTASSRDAFIGGMVHAVVAASWGLRSDLGRQQFRAALTVGGPGNARDAAFMVNARVADAIAAHDQPSARRLLREFLARHPVTSPPAERHLRRFLALGYVLNETLRSWWDDLPLGHCHLQARGVARALVGARSGNRALATSCSATPATVFAVLPLPWSVELACHLGAMGQKRGSDLIEWLVEHVGAAARDELRRVADAHPPLAATARAFLGQIPVEPSAEVQIDVLGPLDVRVDGAGIGRNELRRTRVCELLSMLVLENEITRDRLVDLLWPELPPGSGTANLRVTLAHLRRLLEPERAAGEACFYLRSDAMSVRLVRSAKLRVDLWEWQRLVTESDAAYRRGDVSASIDLSLGAAGRWGDPLVYLRRFEHFEAQLERIERTQVASVLRAGELSVARGSVTDAIWLAEQALRCDQYSERAHRLAIAANLGRGDPHGAHDAARRAVDMLTELGVPAERATDVLLRRALRYRRQAAA